MEASRCVARKIFLSPAIASSSALTLDSRPTTNGVSMYGKMTTSRMGIIGRRFLTGFSFELRMVLPKVNTHPGSRNLPEHRHDGHRPGIAPGVHHAAQIRHRD